MKQLLKPFYFLIITLFIVGCKKETYNLNEEFTVDFNKSVWIKIDNELSKIKFTKLVEDSRCPPDVYCDWIGEVAVKINLDDETDFIIGDHTSIPPTVEYKNHTIHLIDVSYNKKRNYGEEKHCSIKLKVD